jgi:hypothetical protein
LAVVEPELVNFDWHVVGVADPEALEQPETILSKLANLWARIDHQSCIELI